MTCAGSPLSRQAAAAAPVTPAAVATPSPAPSSTAPPGATLAAEVLAERRRQVERFGHDAAADDARLADYGRGHLAREIVVRVTTAADLVSFGRPAADELRRARRKVVQAAALCLAELERLDRELAAALPGDPR